MPRDLITVDEAAERLNVSARRVRAMVEAGQLPAEKMGSRWVIALDALEETANNRTGLAGRPFNEKTCWQIIRGGIAQQRHLDSKGLDCLRRRLRARAKHSDYYIHPGLLQRAEQNSRVVVGGSLAAMEAGAPIDEGGSRDFYIREDHLKYLLNEFPLRAVTTSANIHLHVVRAENWAFNPGTHFTDSFVAWLDLADRAERSAVTLQDRLIGGRFIERD